MTKTWCVGVKHYSNTKNIIEYKKKNPKNKKLKSSLKLLKVLVVFAIVINHKFLLSK